VLSIPLTGTLNSSVLFEDASALTTLARHIDDLLPYLLALGCILFLRELNRPDVFGFPRKETLRIGALLFAFFLAGRTTNLLFIPVPLLLGWWLFRYFAVRPENPSQPAADMVEQIRSFLNYRRSTPILNDLRSAVENKFRKAEISLADYKEKLSEVDALQHQLTGALPGGEQQAEAQIFNYGPGSGPWQNAVMALRAGPVLALPFQFLSLLQFQEDRGGSLRSFPVGRHYPVFAFILGYSFLLVRLLFPRIKRKRWPPKGVSVLSNNRCADDSSKAPRPTARVQRRSPCPNV